MIKLSTFFVALLITFLVFLSNPLIAQYFWTQKEERIDLNTPEQKLTEEESGFDYSRNITGEIADYTWRNPSIHGITIRNIDFVDNNLVFATGQLGVTMVSQDGGATWEKANRPFSSNILTQTIGENNRWLVAGPDGLISYSDDMGQTWISADNQHSAQIQTIHSHQDGKVYVVGNNRTLRVSTDFGATWGALSIPDDTIYNPHNKTNWTYRGIGTHGDTILVGLDGLGMPYQILRSTDGGDTWNTVVVDMNHVGSNQGAGTTDMVLLDDGLTGYASCRRLLSGRLIKTEDGGISWSQVNEISNFEPLPNPDVPYISTAVQDIRTLTISATGDTLVTGGRFGQVLASVDGGATWNEIYGGVRQGNRDFYSVVFWGVSLSQEGKWLVGGSRGIISGADNLEPGGATLINGEDKVITLMDLAFIDEDNGFAVGFETVDKYEFDEDDNVVIVSYAVGAYYKTTDEGETWSREVGPGQEGYRWYDMETTGENNIWIAGMKYIDGQIIGVIAHSSDGGETWAEQYDIPEQEIAMITGFDAFHIYAVTFGKKIISTTDGETWSSSDLPSPADDFNHARSVEVLAPKVVIVGGGNASHGGDAFVLKSHDGGVSWTTLFTSGNPGTIMDVNFIDARYGYASGRWGGIFTREHLLYTNDYGNSWHSIDGDFNGTNSAVMYHIAMKDSVTAYVYGQDGRVIAANGLEDFSPKPRLHDATLWGGYLRNANFGFVTGNGSAIIQYLPGESTNTAPGKFTNVYPDAGETITISAEEIIFSWTESFDPDGDEIVYDFVLESVDGTVEFFRTSTGTDNFFSASMASFGDVDAGIYRWRVEAADDGGLYSTTYPRIVEILIADLSNDASLSDLKVEGTTIDGFDSEVLSYYMELPPETQDTPEVTAVASDENAQVEIEPAVDIFSDQINERTTIITVIAEDNYTTRVYSVLFYVISDNAFLSDLTIEGETIEGFEPEIFNYEKELPEGTVSTPEVNAIAAHESALVQIDSAIDVNSENPEERTTYITITAEDEETVNVYSILFDVKEYYTVTFDVIDEETEEFIGLAIISFAGITNPEGDYVFERIEKGVYSYSIQALFYENITVDGFEVLHDTIKTVALTPEQEVNVHSFSYTEGISVYPNPATNWINVESREKSILKMKVVNLQGLIVYETFSSFYDYKIDVENIEAGIYVLQLITEEKIHSGKIQVY